MQSHLYTIELSSDESRGVLVVSYLCKIIEKVGKFEVDGEVGRAEFQDFPVAEVFRLNMPKFYKVGIQKAWDILQGKG